VKFVIEGKVYDAVDVNKIKMKDMLLFEVQTADFGRRITWEDVLRWHTEVDILEAEKKDGGRQHPEIMWLTAVAIWAARRAAGEDVTFDQAVDVAANDIKQLPDPGDHKKPAASGKAKPRKATGAAVKPAGDASA
jgi:hypothetical protein